MWAGTTSSTRYPSFLPAGTFAGAFFFPPLGQKSSQGERRMGEREAERPRSYAATQVLD